MAPIPKHFLDCSVYFYNSEQAARDGKGSGGSGFLIHVPSRHEGWVHVYAITNKHVLDGGCQVLRLNTMDGGMETVTTQRDSWFDHPDRYDVSVLPIEMGEQLKWSSVGIGEFITRDVIDDYRIGPGDETFLIGRLITPWGQQRNNPAVRFGNISMMADPAEPARGYSGVDQESFFVECRSLSGFSGSPVFVSTTRTYDAEDHIPAALQPTPSEPSEGSGGQGLRTQIIMTSGTWGPWLLGLDWGHLQLWKPVYERDQVTKTDYRVEQNTGIAYVLPAWHILDLLNERELVIQRTKEDDEIIRRNRDEVIPT